MTSLDRIHLRFPGGVRRDAAVDAWLASRPAPLGSLATRWFDALRRCGDDVCELLHDGHPTACIGDAPFAAVNVFTAHINIAFFHGAALADPARLLAGSGRFMRHVKRRQNDSVDDDALDALIRAAYADLHDRLRAL